MIRLPYYFYLTALCFIFLTGIFLSSCMASIDEEYPLIDSEENINKTAKSISELILKKQEVTFSKT